MEAVVNRVNEIVWSPALVWLCLAAGLYFSLRLLFVQVRRIPDMVGQLLAGESSRDGVSSFQALAMSIAGRVGTGNIAGVATAIAFGGPGAVFWMWVVAFFGAATSFVECTLGQIYKERDEGGEYRGGPAYYIEKGLGQRWYGILFAICCLAAMGLFLPGIQANSITGAAQNAWGVDPKMSVIAVLVPLTFIVVGGVKRIAVFAGAVVPVMALGYIILALVVVLMNAPQIPAMFQLIISSAFGQHAVFGGVLGLAVEWGVKRGVYSNEAGQGTGPHPAAAAEVSHPAKQGLAQSFAVYIDTLLVCSATAFMILSTGMYRTYEGGTESGPVLHEGGGGLAKTAEVGPAYTQAALDSAFPGLGAGFVAIALVFFAFTTVVAYYYMAETNLAYLTRGVNPAVRSVLIRVVQLVVLLAVIWGGLASAELAWTMGDIGVGLTAWLNIVAILILQGPAIRALKDYERQRKEKVDPQFDPRPLNIRNAPFWEERADARALHREEAEPVRP
ncbi:alanine or glycine:cation symporter, AGCS family [Kytococcus aerolatus]|uniref:Alanine or glycine:cation symporter, AGCS family n=1 Tax=Kytococcus aerolatus TaxID=592308 RepID=A0A212U267_9MICO|nr:alanine/glycine:cation symporter family protein [Kytococcus aerolatus]SNC72352.1 alanine or glycine:cation symporter, AGCS family [Kytococcus aerolatus]